MADIDNGEHDFPLSMYEVDSEIGCGNFGSVHVYKLREGNTPTHERPTKVAVKTVKRARNAQEMQARQASIEREFDILKNLRHKNIVDFLGCNSVAGSERRRPKIQLVMQLCQLDLAEFTEKRGKLGSDDTSCMIKQVLEGLDYLHSNNVIHRDMKPANVMLLSSQDSPDWHTIQVWDIKVKLGDFGIAKLHDYGSQSFTQTVLGGTLLYMAPEQLEALLSGDTTFRGDSSLDIYPIGVIAYELFTGKRKNGRDGHTNFDELAEEFQEAHPVFLSFLKDALNAESTGRKSAKELLRHDFIVDGQMKVMIKKQDWKMVQMKDQMEAMERRHQTEVEQMRAEIVQMTMDMVQEIQNSHNTIQRQVEAKVKGMEVKNRELQQRVNIVEQENAQLKTQIQALKDDHVTVQRQMEQKTAEVQQLQNEQAENQRMRTGMQEKISDLEALCDRLDRQFGTRMGQIGTNLAEDRQTGRQHSLTPEEQLEVNNDLLEASKIGDVAQMKSALERGAQVEYSDNDDFTSLIWTAWNGHASAVKLLIESNANINATSLTADGSTPLILSALKGNDEVVCILIQNNAEIDKANKYGITPLITAAANGNASTVRLLLQHGADVNKKTNEGDTALGWAQTKNHGETVQILQEWMRR